MKPKFIAGKHKKQTEIEPVFDREKDLQSVLFQIVEDLKEKQNDKLRSRLAVSWKELQFCNINFGGDTLELKINIIDGSLREPQKNPAELQKRLREAYNVLHKFEDAVRKEFKSRTGKSLIWTESREFASHEMVALNGLYRFYALKAGKVKTSLEGQQFAE